MFKLHLLPARRGPARRLRSAQPLPSSEPAPRLRRGQALPLIAIMLVVLIGFTGLALDVSMLLLRTLQQQRAADAAVLAGVVQLPDHFTSAVAVARDYSGRNGYTHATSGYPSVAVTRVSGYTTRLRVVITAFHDVYFMRIFGISQVRVDRSAEAMYAQPVRLGCPDCVSFGIGNATPIAVHDNNPDTECPRCVLRRENFWVSIDGPGSAYANGDGYNTAYLDGYRYGACPGTINTSRPNPDYVQGPNSKTSGYSYAIDVDATQDTPLTLYVYDPAQYFRPFGVTDPDTFDQEACYQHTGTNHRWRFTTYFKLYAPDNTPEYLDDDVLIYSTSFRDDGTTPGPYHNRWMPLTTLDPGLAAAGDFRLQVTTEHNGTNPGVGQNQYALALGGARVPGNAETIYAINRMSLMNNIREIPPGNAIEFYLANVPRENAGDRMGVRMFDPGDALCSTYVQLLDPNRQVTQFLVDWRGSSTTRLDTTTCNPGCTNPYNGRWVTLGVSLPESYTGGWWKVKYNMGSCSGQTTATDRTIWEILMIGNPIHLVQPRNP